MPEITIEVFIVDGACACSIGPWIDSIYRVVRPFKEKKQVTITTLTTDSDRAQKLDVINKCVAVNGVIVPEDRLVGFIEKELAKQTNK